ncbi:GrpB family protein [Candidatus Babeliales bacterium]|nr:GrpB family protein [Candidatus Babeliales bacterium]
MSDRKKISVLPYDPEWANIFKEEKTALMEMLGDNHISIHHVGSTAIPGLDAKPKIDIVAEVHDPETHGAGDR